MTNNNKDYIKNYILDVSSVVNTSILETKK